MDAFAVSAAVAAGLPVVTARHTFRLSWHFGLFQALMTIIGCLLGEAVAGFVSRIDHWIAFVILAGLGAKMIYESQHPENRAADCDPSRGLSLVVLSIATSIDAFAVGFSLSLVGVSVWYPALIIGLVALAMAFAGTKVGRHAGQLIGRWAECAGGLVLIAIGVHILWEHLT
jgi:putative Mn2+ efflux pump MntP